MKLSVEDQKLLREVFTEAYKRGWRGVQHTCVKGFDCNHRVLREWRLERFGKAMFVALEGEGDCGWQLNVNGDLQLFVESMELPTIVDVLVALEYLPVNFCLAYHAGVEAGVESIPWHYGVKDGGENVRRFGENLAAALAWAAPEDDFPQLTVVRWRQGPQEVAVIPDAA